MCVYQILQQMYAGVMRRLGGGYHWCDDRRILSDIFCTASPLSTYCLLKPQIPLFYTSSYLQQFHYCPIYTPSNVSIKSTSKPNRDISPRDSCCYRLASTSRRHANSDTNQNPTFNHLSSRTLFPSTQSQPMKIGR